MAPAFCYFVFLGHKPNKERPFSNGGHSGVSVLLAILDSKMPKNAGTIST